MFKRKKRGQSTIEYVVLLIIVMGAFIASANYIKRGMQGRWKASVDDLGDQYDPRLSNGTVIHRLTANTDTRVITVPQGNGVWTMRFDFSNTIETKTGFLAVQGY